MLDFQDITIQYLSQKFQPELLSVVLDSCILLHGFGLTQYENDLVEMVSGAHDLDSMELRDRFTWRLREELVKLLDQHTVTVDEDAGASLGELTQIGQFLYLVQNLEDTSALGYRIYGGGGARAIFIDLMGIYCPMPRHRAMELVESVDDRLINAIRALVGDRQTTPGIDAQHLTCWRQFCAFTDNAPSLAQELHSQGYFATTALELVALSRIDIAARLNEGCLQSTSQCALDVLGVLLLCKDTWKDPMASFLPFLETLVEYPDSASKARAAAHAIHSDFSNWQEAQRAGAKAGKECVA